MPPANFAGALPFPACMRVPDPLPIEWELPVVARRAIPTNVTLHRATLHGGGDLRCTEFGADAQLEPKWLRIRKYKMHACPGSYKIGFVRVCACVAFGGTVLKLFMKFLGFLIDLKASPTPPAPQNTSIMPFFQLH